VSTSFHYLELNRIFINCVYSFLANPRLIFLYLLGRPGCLKYYFLLFSFKKKSLYLCLFSFIYAYNREFWSAGNLILVYAKSYTKDRALRISKVQKPEADL